MKVYLGTHVCLITLDPDETCPRTESGLLYAVKLALIEQGHDVIKKRMWKDGHMKDDEQQYIRERSGAWGIYSGFYAIEDASARLKRTRRIQLLREDLQ